MLKPTNRGHQRFAPSKGMKTVICKADTLEMVPFGMWNASKAFLTLLGSQEESAEIIRPKLCCHAFIRFKVLLRDEAIILNAKKRKFYNSGTDLENKRCRRCEVVQEH